MANATTPPNSFGLLKHEAWITLLQNADKKLNNEFTKDECGLKMLGSLEQFVSARHRRHTATGHVTVTSESKVATGAVSSFATGAQQYLNDI